MTSNRLPLQIVLSAILAFALLVAAIITGNFWLSLTLGVVGSLAFAYAAFRLREFRRSLFEAEKRKRPPR